MKPALAILAAFSTIASAGPVAPVSPPPPANPLSFAEGRIVFDFENQTRFEFRENNFDFNDSVDALTDDSRVGIEFSYGSGDDNAAEGDQGAFQNLFPTNFFYLISGLKF